MSLAIPDGWTGCAPWPAPAPAVWAMTAVRMAARTVLTVWRIRLAGDWVVMSFSLLSPGSENGRRKLEGGQKQASMDHLRAEGKGLW
jgi:hypothetical protein